MPSTLRRSPRAAGASSERRQGDRDPDETTTGAADSIIGFMRSRAVAMPQHADDLEHTKRAPALGDVDPIVNAIRRAHDAVNAVCVFGSVARGDAAPTSDIDLLVLGDDTALTRRAVLDAIPSTACAFPLSLAYFTADRLLQVMRGNDSFAQHLRRECVVVWERDTAATRILTEPAVGHPAMVEIVRQLERLQAFERPERFNGRLLFPLAHLYVIAKAVVMARLVGEHAHEFNRDRAFSALCRQHPELVGSLRRLESLRPFWAQATGRADAPAAPLPRASSAVVTRAVSDIRRVGAVDGLW